MQNVNTIRSVTTTTCMNCHLDKTWRTLLHQLRLKTTVIDTKIADMTSWTV